MDRWIGRGIREDFVGPFFCFLFLVVDKVVGKDPVRAGKNDPTQLDVVWRQKKEKKEL